MILILGGGITGLAAARTLAAAGEDFLVFEAEAEPGPDMISSPTLTPLGQMMYRRSPST